MRDPLEHAVPHRAHVTHIQPREPGAEAQVQRATRARLALIAILVPVLCGCGRKQETSAPVDPPSPGSSAASQAQAAGDEDWTDGVVRDRGTECEQHEYLLKPGEQQQLVFESKLGLGPDNPPELTLQKTALDGTGVLVDVAWPEYSSYRFPVWVIDARQAFAEMEAQGQQRPVATVFRARERIAIGWDANGLGVFDLRFDGRLDPERTGALSEEEVRQRLGESIQVGAKTYPTQLTRDTRDGKVLVMRLSITTPSDQASSQFLKHVILSGSPSGKVEISIGWTRTEGFYRVSGPAQAAACFE